MAENGKFTLEEAHLSFAKSLNGEAWSLLEKNGRSKEENETMIHAAHASAYHWLKAGTGVHHQRSEWLISHVYAVLGMAEPAQWHAERCTELTKQFSNELKDFDLAYGYEALARAHAAAGNREQTLQFIGLAKQYGEAIQNEEDRRIFLGDLEAGDWYGSK
jgi:hypothetical protein